MRDTKDLRSELERIDSRGFKAYKAISGTWRFPLFRLSIDHAQGDPFAAPSQLRVLVDKEIARLPAQT